jgi:hypothetical protein
MGLAVVTTWGDPTETGVSAARSAHECATARKVRHVEVAHDDVERVGDDTAPDERGHARRAIPAARHEMPTTADQRSGLLLPLL